MEARATFPSITSSTNLGPLTPTAFPTACLSTLWDLNTPGLGGSQSYETQGCAVSTCCPSGNFYTDDFAWMSTYYSPGWCPSAYRECPPPRGSTSLKTSNGESVAFCCPTNYACPSTASLNTYQFCQSLYSGTTEVVVLNNIYDQKTISTRSLTVPSGQSSTYLVAYPIQIRRQKGQAIPTAEPASSSRSNPSSSPTKAAQVQSQAESSKSLSGGAIAGIVIGTVVGLVIIGLLIWIALILRRRGRSSQKSPNPGAPYDDIHEADVAEKTELSADQSENGLPPRPKLREPPLVELQGSEGGTELPQGPH